MKSILLAGLLMTVGTQTPSDQLATALRAGFEAEDRDDGKALMQAAITLRQIGARPVEGEPDLADLWDERARLLGTKETRLPLWRGRVLGPAYRYGELAANARFTTRQSFIAGQKANVVVEPRGGVKLELAVNDDAGAPVCQVSASSKTLGCQWVPTFTGTNVIDIVNTEARPVRFYLILN